MASTTEKSRTSVKSYQEGIDLEKQKMVLSAKRMGKNVKSLQTEFQSHSKVMREAARNMISEGNKNMSTKVRKFLEEIKHQTKENKESITHIENSVKLFQSEINKKKNDFRAYARGPFASYLKTFLG